MCLSSCAQLQHLPVLPACTRPGGKVQRFQTETTADQHRQASQSDIYLVASCYAFDSRNAPSSAATVYISKHTSAPQFESEPSVCTTATDDSNPWFCCIVLLVDVCCRGHLMVDLALRRACMRRRSLSIVPSTRGLVVNMQRQRCAACFAKRHSGDGSNGFCMHPAELE